MIKSITNNAKEKINNNLINFNKNYLVYSFGLRNNNIICYFNALIQSLLSVN